MSISGIGSNAAASFLQQLQQAQQTSHRSSAHHTASDANKVTQQPTISAVSGASGMAPGQFLNIKA